MDRTAAVKLIRETFENPFDKERFRNFTKNLLSHIEIIEGHPYSGNLIPDAYESFISTLERIGKYSDNEDHKIDILMVKLKKGTSLDRARSRQRNFIAWYLNGSRGGELKDAALVAFVSPDEDDWRFSLVKMDYHLEESLGGKIKVKTELTPARRWSFLVGKHESSHTAQIQLLPILENDKLPELSDLEKAFNIEVVTREFFKKYRELFDDIKEALQSIVKKDSRIREDFNAKSIDIANFAKKLLGQTVFLYFLQKKGWLGVPENKNWGEGDKKFLRTLFEKCKSTNTNFFNDYLEYLFYDALNNQDRGTVDPSYYNRFNCKIPFLNGGLFDPMNNYDWAYTDILIPNELFSNNEKTKEGDTGNGILDVFDRYNFTVKEDEPLDKEVAIDPEMLGKVFENLLEVKDRKSRGTFYTPREIVHYMCQESLINYLDTAINTGDVPLVPTAPPQGKLFGKPDPEQGALKIMSYRALAPREDIEAFVRMGELAIEHDARVESKGRETRDYSYKLQESIRWNAKLIDDKLASIKVCDPAIGSGAFPVGLMTEIVRARNTLTTYLPDKDARNIYRFKRHAIQNCLYGVDIDPGAVEIAKLRLWLSLVVDEEDIRQIKPLPNLDYKIMQGDSLITEFMGIDLDNADNKQDGQLIFQRDETDTLIQELQNKKDEYLNKANAGEKQKVKQEIENLIIRIFETKLQEQKKDYFNKIKTIEGKYKSIPSVQQREDAIQTEKEKLYKTSGFDLEKFEEQLREYTAGNKIRPFFPWRLYFAEVFHEKGGFDVVIANPPYIFARNSEMKGLTDEDKKYFYAHYQLAEYQVNLYPLFIEKGTSLLKPNGCLCFITPNNWLTINTNRALRKFVLSQSDITIVNFYSRVFESSEVDSSIIIYRNASDNRRLALYEYMDSFQFIKESDCNFFLSQREHVINIEAFRDKGVASLIDKIDSQSITLEQLADVKVGLKAYQVGKGKPKQNQKAKEGRIFHATRKINNSFYKYLDGKDVSRYRIDWSGEYLQYGDHLAEPRKDFSLFSSKRILVRQIPAKPPYCIHACLVEETALNDLNSMNIINFRESPESILGILNSRLISFWFVHKFGKMQRNTFPQFKVNELANFPLPTNREKKQEEIAKLVKQILATNKCDPATDSSWLERQIDRMVYELYGLTPKEIAVVEGKK